MYHYAGIIVLANGMQGVGSRQFQACLGSGTQHTQAAWIGIRGAIHPSPIPAHEGIFHIRKWDENYRMFLEVAYALIFHRCFLDKMLSVIGYSELGILSSPCGRRCVQGAASMPLKHDTLRTQSPMWGGTNTPRLRGPGDPD